MDEPGGGPEGPVPRVPRAVALGAAAALLLGLAVFAAVERHAKARRFAACPVAARVAAGTLGGPFELTDRTGAHVTDATLLAKGAALISFAGDAAAEGAAVASRNLDAARILGGGVTAVVIMPGADPGEASALPPELVVLTGPRAAARRLAAKFGLRDPGGATGAPAGPSFLVLPGLGTVARFPAAMKAAGVAAQAGCFIGAAPG